jgi:hypothetical protein
MGRQEKVRIQNQQIQQVEPSPKIMGLLFSLMKVAPHHHPASTDGDTPGIHSLVRLDTIMPLGQVCPWSESVNLQTHFLYSWRCTLNAATDGGRRTTMIISSHHHSSIKLDSTHTTHTLYHLKEQEGATTTKEPLPKLKEPTSPLRSPSSQTLGHEISDRASLLAQQALHSISCGLLLVVLVH